MAWPYGFPSLTHEEKLLRRQTLDLYACIAHYSALAPAVLFLLYRLLKRVVSHVKSGSSSEQTHYSVVPNSPTVKAQLQRPSASQILHCRGFCHLHPRPGCATNHHYQRPINNGKHTRNNSRQSHVLIPVHKLTPFRATPGSHIYLSVPPQGRSAAVPSSKSAIFDYLYNPFTVAAVDAEEGTISLIARVRNGPMTNVLSAYSSATPRPPSEPRKITLAVEGPYGTMATKYNDLLKWGATKVLLVSGGVGATFTLPIYQALQSELSSAKLQFIWAIRGAGDATWAVSNKTTGQVVLEDPNIQLYLTGDLGLREQDNGDSAGGSVELSSMRRTNGRLTANHNKKRPNIEKIVDDMFRGSPDESVAVLVCGPIEMNREVQRRVRPWVMKGRRVWWHNETFGW
ncbi:Ferric reductase, NAD binding protein [Metarhizium robertsii ARSEF 23]|uniref:Ferric reductase, NAD binding protein n=1 Tax=Metarhizium robertsii (strain ARSEF 23 / ATCC MYA-3075) TaxID=655844 RepID=E9EX47_METRA|nr:Ferric reductase, NAD binding protein [Metarhizium robertsii ARSEF 23]EFY99667.2 Ferric reductase, NAD binding protein [Metarhizium robertsii ARSEF 23]